MHGAECVNLNVAMAQFHLVDCLCNVDDFYRKNKLFEHQMRSMHGAECVNFNVAMAQFHLVDFLCNVDYFHRKN